MNPAIASGLAAATAITGVFAVYQILSDLFLRDRSRVNDRVDYEFLQKRKERAKKSPLFKNLGQIAASASMVEGHRPSIRHRFNTMVEQSGMDLTPERLLAIAGGAAVMVGAGAFVFRRNPLDLVIAAACGGLIPIWVVRRRRNKRIEKLRSQLPDAFELMTRVVRAGQTLNQALLAVADEFPQPLSAEFAYCYEQQNLGLSPEAAFRDLNRRTDIIELKIFVLAVLVQQQTGGNLAELLTKLSTVIRERYQIRSVIRSLTAEGRMQGWILAGLPPLMLLFLLVINPAYASIHFKHANILLCTFGVELLGALWIRKIVNFDF
jgi:tight adherence protein B